MQGQRKDQNYTKIKLYQRKMKEKQKTYTKRKDIIYKQQSFLGFLEFSTSVFSSTSKHTCNITDKECIEPKVTVHYIIDRLDIY